MLAFLVLNAMIGYCGSISNFDLELLHADFLSTNGLLRPLLFVDSDSWLIPNLAANVDSFTVVLYDDTVGEDLAIHLKVINNFNMSLGCKYEFSPALKTPAYK